MSDFGDTVAKLRREQLRWYLLLGLYYTRPIGAHTEVLLTIAQSSISDATHAEVRRELDYLEDRELVKIDRDPTDRWSADLTRHGVDIVEYAVDVQPGIARPKKSGA